MNLVVYDGSKGQTGTKLRLMPLWEGTIALVVVDDNGKPLVSTDGEVNSYILSILPEGKISRFFSVDKGLGFCLEDDGQVVVAD